MKNTVCANEEQTYNISWQHPKEAFDGIRKFYSTYQDLKNAEQLKKTNSPRGFYAYMNDNHKGNLLYNLYNFYNSKNFEFPSLSLESQFTEKGIENFSLTSPFGNVGYYNIPDNRPKQTRPGYISTNQIDRAYKIEQERDSEKKLVTQKLKDLEESIKRLKKS